MSNILSVAAGGGGDALAALIVDRVLSPGEPRRQVVASFSWDRYIIDPTPGPRSVDDFTGLVRRTPLVWEVMQDSELRGGGTSGLAILARHTAGRFFLLDPSGGTEGVHAQIAELAAYIDATQIRLVDVGGDIAARGDEPTLSSPLADSLALAAAAGQAQPVTVVVAGPGLDGELPEKHVRDRMASSLVDRSRISSSEVKSFTAALDHHPSEATALISAAAIGIEGRAEIRDSASLVELTPASADLLVADAGELLTTAAIAQALIGTQSFTQAEQVTRQICGRTELDYERSKAAALARSQYNPPTPDQIRERIFAHIARAGERGATLVSLRRLTEVAGLRTYDPALIRSVIGDRAFDDVPLCRLQSDPSGLVLRPE